MLLFFLLLVMVLFGVFIVLDVVVGSGFGAGVVAGYRGLVGLFRTVRCVRRRRLTERYCPLNAFESVLWRFRFRSA